MPYIHDELDEAVGSGWRKTIAIIVGLIAGYIILALIFSFWPFSVASGVAKKVVNPSAIVQNYEWFYDQYNAIKAQEANVAIIPADAVELPGLKMVLNNAIAEYNSRSRQITRNLWKASDLPYQISLETEK